MKKIIIIGNGPAGISAALYTQRAGIKTTIIGKDSGALQKADKIENYYGFENPIEGEKLISSGINQAKRLGVNLINDEVVGMDYDGNLIIKTTNKEYKADSVIIATGSGRVQPKINGINKFIGKGISYCAVCDAFFYKGKDVAVLGNSEYALSEAKELINIANSVTIITNGDKPNINFPNNIKIITDEIDEFAGNNHIENIKFKNGNTLPISGVFIALGVAGSTDLARKIGASIDGKNIVVNENMETDIPGLYAAGDCTGGMLQIAKAVYEGAKAGTQAIKYLRKKDN